MKKLILSITLLAVGAMYSAAEESPCAYCDAIAHFRKQSMPVDDIAAPKETPLSQKWRQVFNALYSVLRQKEIRDLQNGPFNQLYDTLTEAHRLRPKHPTYDTATPYALLEKAKTLPGAQEVITFRSKGEFSVASLIESVEHAEDPFRQYLIHIKAANVLGFIIGRISHEQPDFVRLIQIASGDFLKHLLESADEYLDKAMAHSEAQLCVDLPGVRSVPITELLEAAREGRDILRIEPMLAGIGLILDQSLPLPLGRGYSIEYMVDIRAHLIRAKELLEQNDMRAALEHLKEAQSLTPDVEINIPCKGRYNVAHMINHIIARKDPLADPIA